MGTVVILPSSGINYLWQLKRLVRLSKQDGIKKIYACSGGVWASLFLALGKDVAEDWLKRAPSFMSDWSAQNKYEFNRKRTSALAEDSFRIFNKYGLFEMERLPFKLYVRVYEVYPEPRVRIIDMSDKSIKEIYSWAIASSTIPGITGSIAHKNDSYYVDGGIKPVWTLDEIHPEDYCEERVVIDAYKRLHKAASVHIWPQNRLSHGLKLAMPLEFDKSYFNGIINAPAELRIKQE